MVVAETLALLYWMFAASMQLAYEQAGHNVFVALLILPFSPLLFLYGIVGNPLSVMFAATQMLGLFWNHQRGALRYFIMLLYELLCPPFFWLSPPGFLSPPAWLQTTVLVRLYRSLPVVLSAPFPVENSHPDEKWFFVNGVATTQEVAISNASLLNATFKREVTCLYNPTESLLLDLLECGIGKFWPQFGVPPRTFVRQTVSAALSDPQYSKVVLIAHSQGTIISSNAVAELLREDVPIEKLEVYAFANCAQEFNNLTTASLRTTSSRSPSAATPSRCSAPSSPGGAARGYGTCWALMCQTSGRFGQRWTGTGTCTARRSCPPSWSTASTGPDCARTCRRHNDDHNGCPLPSSLLGGYESGLPRSRRANRREHTGCPLANTTTMSAVCKRAPSSILVLQPDRKAYS